MRCPKCHYLSFDPEPRCRNCGYDLEVADTDLAIRTAEIAEAAAPDLTLREPARPPTRTVTLELSRPEPEPELKAESGPEFEPDLAHPDDESEDHRLALDDDELPVRFIDEDVPAPSSPPARILELPAEFQAPPKPQPPPKPIFRAPNTTAELPLFVKGSADREFPDEATLPRARTSATPAQVPAAPRPPLGVRRSAPEPGRSAARPVERRLGPLDHDLLEDLKRLEREEAVQKRAEALAIADALEASEPRVEPAHRAAAAAIDMAVLGSIALFVFWATLRLCEVSAWDLGLASLAPLALFVALMDVGYLLMFTAAGGQTVGKMMMGIRVVAASDVEDEQLSLRQAAWRAILTLVSVGGLGLGWLPALFGRGVTMHDRLAHTRVVRA
jgi:uncharacterized RDD family membrane protein YckC